MKTLITCFVLIASIFSLDCFANEQFVVKINPGCGDLCSNESSAQLIYGRLPRSADSLHIFVTVGDALGNLAITYLQSADPAQMVQIDWDKAFSGDPAERRDALQFSNPKAAVLAKFTLAFSTLIEYSDNADISVDQLAPDSNASYYSFASFHWSLLRRPAISGGLTELALIANRTADNASSWAPDSLFQSGGSVQLSLQLSPSPDRAQQLPQLQFTGNNSQLELLLNSLVTSRPNARFAVQAALLANAAAAGSQQEIDEKLSIDDEFTPGIFRVTDWQSFVPSCYAQWKPVCYVGQRRSIANSTVVRRSGQLAKLRPDFVDSLSASFVYSLYPGHGEFAQLLAAARQLNVSFGPGSKKFYSDTNYTVWTFSVGLGEPPSDAVSALVIIVILCGLGLPLLLMAASGVYLCVRRVRQARGEDHGSVSAYQPINA